MATSIQRMPAQSSAIHDDPTRPGPTLPGPGHASLSQAATRPAQPRYHVSVAPFQFAISLLAGPAQHGYSRPRRGAGCAGVDGSGAGTVGCAPPGRGGNDREGRAGMGRGALARTATVWYRLDRYGRASLAWHGLRRHGLAWPGMACAGLDWAFMASFVRKSDIPF